MPLLLCTLTGLPAVDVLLPCGKGAAGGGVWLAAVCGAGMGG